MSLGKNLKALREAKGLDQKELEKLSGVRSVTISAIEVRNSKRSEFAAPLAAALGVSVEALLSDDYTAFEKATPPALIGKPATDAATTLAQALEVVAQALQGADELSRIQAKPLIQHLMEHPEQAANITHRLAALLNRSGLPPAQTSDFAAPAPTHHFQKTPNGA